MARYDDWNSYFWEEPDDDVLSNKLGIRNAGLLDEAEEEIVTARMKEGCPSGDFGVDHLKDIHRHLFEPLYDWAGEFRAIYMFSTAEAEYVSHERIEGELRRIHAALAKQDFLRGLPPDAFTEEVARLIRDINHACPFREGNGRTMLVYLDQLAAQAGHTFDSGMISNRDWRKARDYANNKDTSALVSLISAGIVSADVKDGRQEAAGRAERAGKYARTVQDEQEANRRAEALREQARARDDKKTR